MTHLRKLFGLALAVAALTVAPRAQTLVGVKPVTFFDTTLSNETVTATSVQLDAGKVAVPLGTVPIIQLTQVAENAGTQNVIVHFKTSLDGVNWTTTYPYSITNALNGTNAVTAIQIIGTNIPARFITVGKIVTAQTNLVTLSSGLVTFISP